MTLADVPSKISQPGKDYRSAIKARGARVKGDHQMTKDIGKTHFHNGNFNKLTIPIIVKGQALTSTNNPVNRQSSKSSHKKDHNVSITGDSHTRLIPTVIESLRSFV